MIDEEKTEREKDVYRAWPVVSFRFGTTSGPR